MLLSRSCSAKLLTRRSQRGISSLFDENLVLSRGEKDFQNWVNEEQEAGTIFIHPGVVVTKSEEKGFSLQATRNIPAGESIIKLSASLYEQFSAQAAENYMLDTNPGFHYQVTQFANSVTPHEHQQKNLTGSICLAVQFLFSQSQSDMDTDHYREQRKMQGGFSPAYARMLFENTYPWNMMRLPHALSIPEHLIQWMAGTGLHKTFNSRRTLYNKLSQRVLGHEMHVTQLSSVMAIILSRAMSGQDGSGRALPLGMVPVIDFANHADTPNARHSYNEDKALLLEALPISEAGDNGGIKAGMEITISYGVSRDSSSFLTLYSFLPRPLQTPSTPRYLINPNDVLSITVMVDNVRRRVNIPKAIIFAAISLMNKAENSADNATQRNTEIIKIFEMALQGYVPNILEGAQVGMGGVDAIMGALESEISAREDSHRLHHPKGSLEPLYMTQCRAESERKFLSMCEEVVESELEAVKTLLRCCQAYRRAVIAEAGAAE